MAGDEVVWLEGLSPWPKGGFGLERMRALLAELGAGRDAQVILTASDPRALLRARDPGQAGARDA